MFLLACVALCGCPGKQVITETPTVEAAEEQQATCKVAKDPLNPLIVEWPGTSKVDLDSASQRTVVVVSYAGCTLKVLTSCRARLKKEDEGAPPYELTSVTPARDKLQMSDQSELYARLPLGAASLKGELGVGSSLELDYIAVGQRVAKSAPEVLDGECEGATHFIRTITVGAYSLDVKAKGKASASVEVGNAGAGAGREESKRNLRGSGDVDACASDPESKDCGAVLQLGLAPLQREGEKILNSAGFGAGLGPTGNVYIPNLDNLNTSSASFRNVDSAYLKLVDSAMTIEKQKPVPATEKVRAWERVRDYKTDGDFADEAGKRVEEWERVAEAEERRHEAMQKLREKYLEDKRKLDELLEIQSETLATPAQKSAWRKEFELAYSPHQKDLEELGLRSSTGSGSSGSGGSGSSDTPGATPEDKKDYALGTAFGIEAEVGYATWGGMIATAHDSGTGEATETVYVIGGDNLAAGLNFGFPNLGAGFGVMATIKSYTALNPCTSGDSALAFGALLRWSLPFTDFVGMELAAGGGYGLYVTDGDLQESGECRIPVDFNGNDSDDDSYTVTAKGGSFDLLAGLIFRTGVFMVGARGGLNAAAISVSIADEADDELGDGRLELANTELTNRGETSVGGTVSAVLGVEF